MRLDPGVVTLGEQARGLLQFRRAHVIRRRVDQVARQGDALGDARKVGGIDAVRHDERRELVLALAVAVEAIAPSAKASAASRVSCGALAKCIDARGEQAGQVARQQRVCARRVFFEPNRTPAMPPVGRGQREMLSGIRLEACGIGKGPRLRLQAGANPGQFSEVTNQMGMAAARPILAKAVCIAVS